MAAMTAGAAITGLNKSIEYFRQPHRGAGRTL
jgi:hypothetical protein